jgi:hypothetical protein
MPNRGEFRATTDQMLEILDELRALEVEKRAAAVGSRDFVDLARRAADQGRLAFRWTQLQLQMATEAAALLAAGKQAPDVHLVDVVPRPIDRILALWREAQIRLEIAQPGSPAAQSAADDIERLREEYQAATLARGDDAAALAAAPGVPDRAERRRAKDD